MYSTKDNVLELVALLREYDIREMVLCSGSRNIPLLQSISACDFFRCYAFTDERSAAFFALGRALQSHCPAAVCCTSGSAVANILPAVAEAFYQRIPLLVISADRTAPWIGQMDGQTMPQPYIFGPLVKKCVDIEEPHTEEQRWHCNRLINEALLALTDTPAGPVHINVRLSEPLFDFSLSTLPSVRVIKRYSGDIPYEALAETINSAEKKMILCGQLPPPPGTTYTLPIVLQHHFLCVWEHTANDLEAVHTIGNVDLLLQTFDDHEKNTFTPDLLITCGGHIISKRLKQYLRQYKPREHWHIDESGEVVDLFAGALTKVIRLDPFLFFARIASFLSHHTPSYPIHWCRRSSTISSPCFPYSHMRAVGLLLEAMPTPASLHLANSSTVRYAQFFPLKRDVEVACNRGINGIEGSLSTALGYAANDDKLNFILIGDLSFFYDMNALWLYSIPHLRILLFNNGGGEIFQALAGLSLSPQARDHILGSHDTSARAWACDRGFEYLEAHDEATLSAAMARFTIATPTDTPMLLEVFTDGQKDIDILNAYYHQLQQKCNETN